MEAGTRSGLAYLGLNGERAMKIKTAFILARVAWVAFAPVSALAGSQEDQQACMNDALTMCRVAGCLISNRSRISEACLVALSRAAGQSHSRPLTVLPF